MQSLYLAIYEINYTFNNRDSALIRLVDWHCSMKIIYKHIYERGAQLIMRRIAMFGILSLIVIAASADRKAFVYPEAKTWITTENFTTMISKSFVYSRCCNIYLSGRYACDWIMYPAKLQIPPIDTLDIDRISLKFILESNYALPFQTRFTMWRRCSVNL